MDFRENQNGKMRDLLEKATNSTEAEVEPRLLRAIKYYARQSDAEIQLAADTLMSQMKRDHSQVRYLSLLVIDELFIRSKFFRNLIVGKFDQLLSLSIGFRKTSPLPRPHKIAVTLRSKAIEVLEKWKVSFGLYYPQIRLGFDYLKDTLQFQFPNILETQARLEEERRLKHARYAEILKKKFDSFKDKFPSIKDEIHSAIKEIEECLKLVAFKVEDVSNVPLDEDDSEEFRPYELREIRFNSLKESEAIYETSENEVIVRTLKEMYKILVMKHQSCIQEWISLVLKVESDNISLRDSILKDLIDIRNAVLSIRKKCEDLDLGLSEETEDFWENGGVVPSEATEPVSQISTERVKAGVLKQKIEPCGAPMRNGEICRRRDLRVCPFHGPIVPRDQRGNPLVHSGSANEALGTSLVQQSSTKETLGSSLAEPRSTIGAIKGKGKKDDKSVKRAKIVMIREHNDGVLRDAALASSSSIYGNVEVGIRGYSVRSKPATLASMLRRKVTSRDRLAKRLFD